MDLSCLTEDTSQCIPFSNYHLQMDFPAYAGTHQVKIKAESVLWGTDMERHNGRELTLDLFTLQEEIESRLDFGQVI